MNVKRQIRNGIRNGLDRASPSCTIPLLVVLGSAVSGFEDPEQGQKCVHEGN
jgi:hypothetical protein